METTSYYVETKMEKDYLIKYFKEMGYIWISNPNVKKNGTELYPCVILTHEKNKVAEWDLFYNQLSEKEKRKYLNKCLNAKKVIANWLWEQLEDVLFVEAKDFFENDEDYADDITLVLASNWQDFEAGTNRESIWVWFKRSFDISVPELMYGTGMPRFSREEIDFEDEVFIEEDYSQICAYMCETDLIDSIAGIDSKNDYNESGEYVGHKEFFTINYYPTYNWETDSFSVIISVTIHDEDGVKNYYPDIAEKLFEYYNSEVYPELDISKEEAAIIFKKFKDYCVKDCKERYTVNNFSDLISEIKKELN